MKLTRKIWKSVLIPLVPLTILTPVIVSNVTAVTAYKQNKEYVFENESFKNKKDLYDHAVELADINESDILERDKWSIEWNGQTYYFSDLNKLLNTLEGLIKTDVYETSSSIEVGANGEVSFADYGKLNVEAQPKREKIYRGKDNTYFSTEKDAKNSYLQIHDAYSFNGIYFRTKEELAAYLNKYYDSLPKPSREYFTIKGPKNIYSSPINVKKIKAGDQKEIEQLKLFVRQNSEKYLEVKSQEKGKPVYWYYNNDEIDDNIANITVNYNDYDFIPINSNQGKPNYIVDLDRSDKYDLIGPYYVKSSSIIENITDRKLWTKIDGTDYQIAHDMRTNELVSNFINFIVEEGESSVSPFYYEAIGSSIDLYFNNLRTNYPDVYSSVMNLDNQMRKGKRYSAFYRLPILYIHTIERLVKRGYDHNIIKQTKYIYNLTTNYIDSIINHIVPMEFLVPNETTIDTHNFSLTEIFNFNNPSFDLNSDITYFTDLIRTKYKKLLSFIEVFSNIYSLSTFIPFPIQFSKSTYYNIFKSNLNNFNAIEIDKISKIWNAMLDNDSNKFKDLISENALSNKQPYDELIYKSLDFSFLGRKKIGLLNTYEFLKEDISQFKKDNTNYNSNIQYYIFDSLFFELPKKVINEFINIFDKNELDPIETIKLLLTLKISWKFEKNINNLLRILNAPVNDLTKILSSIFNEHKVDLNYIMNLSTYIFRTSFLPLTMMINNNLSLDKINKNITQSLALTNFVKASQTIFKGISKISEVNTKVKKVYDSISKLTSALAPIFKAVPYVEAALVILDFIMPKVDKHSYLYKNDDVEFIWNGGCTINLFAGLISVDKSNINDMKILNPLKVTEEHVENCKYFNGTKYYDDDLLKKDQLVDILNGRYVGNDSIKNKYFFKEPKRKQYTIDENGFDSIISDDFNRIIDSIVKNIDLYKGEYVYPFADGFVKESNLKEKSISMLLEKIKPVKIATLPRLDELGFPVSIDNNMDDGSIPKYELPDKSWNPIAGEIINDTDNKYIIVDPNIEDNMEMPVKTNPEKTLTDKFYNSFSVKSKTILSNDKYYNSSFSDFNPNIEKGYLYSVKLANGKNQIFLSKGNALKWLLSECNLTVYDWYRKETYYTYKGTTYNSLNEYLRWVDSVVEVKND